MQSAPTLAEEHQNTFPAHSKTHKKKSTLTESWKCTRETYSKLIIRLPEYLNSETDHNLILLCSLGFTRTHAQFYIHINKMKNEQEKAKGIRTMCSLKSELVPYSGHLSPIRRTRLLQLLILLQINGLLPESIRSRRKVELWRDL